MLRGELGRTSVGGLLWTQWWVDGISKSRKIFNQLNDNQLFKKPNKFPRQLRFKLWTSVLWTCILMWDTNVSEYHAASSFRVKWLSHS